MPGMFTIQHTETITQYTRTVGYKSIISRLGCTMHIYTNWYKNQAYTVASAPAATGSVFMPIIFGTVGASSQ